MGIAPSVEDYLAGVGIAYRVLVHRPTAGLEQAAEAVGVRADCIARAVVMRTAAGPVMAVLPLTHLIDLDALAQLTGGVPQPVAADDLQDTFQDCAPGCIPPVGKPYGLPVLYDQSLLTHDYVVFEGGGHDSLLRIPRDGMCRLVERGQAARFSRSIDAIMEAAGTGGGLAGLTPTDDLRARVAEIYKLPAMPGLAQRLLVLQTDPDANARDLSEVVQLDPGLAAQVICCARSAFFGYPCKVDSVQETISRVLGFDMVLNLALGLALVRAFKVPQSGPLGLKSFWRDAAFTAALVQRLAGNMSYSQRPKPGLAYLSGLLHNFGFLVFGHLFQPEFFLLNRMMAANPRVPVTVLEKQVLCMGQAKDVLCLGHASVGSCFMRAWNMPDEVVVAVGEQHNAGYRGTHAVYSNLVLVAGHLLKTHGLGDAECDTPPPEALGFLGLEGQRARDVAGMLVEECEGVTAHIDEWVA